MDENEAVVIAVLAVVVAIVLSKLPPTAISQKGKNPSTPTAAIIDYTEPSLRLIYGANVNYTKSITTTTKRNIQKITTISKTKESILDDQLVIEQQEKQQQHPQQQQQQQHKKKEVTELRSEKSNLLEFQESIPIKIATAGYFYQKGRPRPITLTTAIATTTIDEDATDYPRLRELYRRTKHSIVFLLIFEIDFLNFIVL